MALPMVTIPSSMIHLPLMNKDIKVRAMNIKEEKVLLTAKDAGEREDSYHAVKELITACTFNEIEFADTPITDIISIFIKIIELSKGTKVEHSYRCMNTVTDETGNHTCGTNILVNIDLKDTTFGEVPDDTTIHLDNNIVINMKYPTPRILKKATEKATTIIDGKKKISEIDSLLYMYAFCIDSIFEGDKCYSEFTDDEIYEWLLSLSSNLKKFNEFFEKIPSAELSYTVKCPKCGYEERIVVKELEDFFI